MADLEKKLNVCTQELTMAGSALALRDSELEALQGCSKELEELREMKEVRWYSNYSHSAVFKWFSLICFIGGLCSRILIGKMSRQLLSLRDKLINWLALKPYIKKNTY